MDGQLLPQRDGNLPLAIHKLAFSLVEVMAPMMRVCVLLWGVVSVDTKLLVTLRMLRGASYIDIPETHVDPYFLETVAAMNRCRLFDNSKLPSTDAEIETGMTTMPGTIGAVDGFHVRIRRPGFGESDGRLYIFF